MVTLRRLLSGIRGAVRPGVLVTGGVASSAIVVVLAATIGGGPAPPGTANLWIEVGAGACTRQAAPVDYASSASPDARCGALATACTAANGGDTVLIKAGSYTTTWAGCTSAKAPQVSFAAAIGEHVTLGQISLSPAGTGGYFSLDGVTAQSFDTDSGNSNGSPTWKNITIKNSTFTGSAYFRQCGGNNTGITFDHNLHANIDPSTFEGRIHFPGSTAGNCDVTIKNSIFSGGTADGIQSGAKGVVVTGNLFDTLQDCGCGPHTDSIQVFGGTTITNNFFTRSTDTIVQFDGGGGNPNTITGNVMDDVTGNPWCVTLGGDTNSLIEHNSCPGLEINMTSKGGSNSLGATIRNNIASTIDLVDSDSTAVPAFSDYQLCSLSGCAGAHSIRASATFTGGSNPTTFGGYALTALSAGKGVASDGTDIGATAFATPWVGAGNPN